MAALVLVYDWNTAATCLSYVSYALRAERVSVGTAAEEQAGESDWSGKRFSSESRNVVYV